MKKIIIPFVLILLSSCKIYIDTSTNIHDDSIDFNFLSDHNEFTYKSKVNATADLQVFEKIHFSVNLPKKIINWYIANNDFYFEFDNKQIIYIKSSYKDQYKNTNWELKETNKEEIKTLLFDYWNKRNYKEEKLAINMNRVCKVYTDGKVKILLYNIKPENFDKYLSQISNFKYLN